MRSNLKTEESQNQALENEPQTLKFASFQDQIQAEQFLLHINNYNEIEQFTLKTELKRDLHSMLDKFVIQQAQHTTLFQTM